MKHLLFPALAACMLVGCEHTVQPINGPQPASVTGAKTSQADLPFEQDVYNSCCNEWVHISTTVHLVWNAADGFHGNFHNTIGWGASGDVYHGGSAQNITIVDNPVEGNLSESLVMTSASGCKFRMKLTLHITLNANGDFTAEHFFVTMECL